MSISISTNPVVIVSVVIPTYNRASILERCLQSLVEQTLQDFEVLVCDDGSTDNTEQIVSKFSGILKIKYYWNKNFGGPARPRNVGINYASGKYIAFLDSDDWWMSEKLEICIQELEKGFDICYHDLSPVGKKLQRFSRQSLNSAPRPVSSPVYDDLLWSGNFLPNSSVVVRTDILRRIGGISEDPRLIAAEDYDCWLRVSQETEKFLYIPKKLGFYWSGENNIGKNMKQRFIHGCTIEMLHKKRLRELRKSSNFWHFDYHRKRHWLRLSRYIIISIIECIRSFMCVNYFSGK